MIDFLPYVPLVGLAFVFVGAWVRINAQIAKLDTRGQSEKAVCDGQMVLLRTEMTAVEARSDRGIAAVRAQLDRIDGKVDRLLERHP